MLKTTNALRKFSIKSISYFSMVFPNETTTKCGLYMEKYNIRNFRGLGLKKKYLKDFICYSLILFTFYTPVFAVPPEYYSFSPDIYDQSKILSRQNLDSLSTEELDKKLNEELLYRKTEELEKNFLKRINESINILDEEFCEASKGQFKKKIIEVLSTNTASFPLVGMLTGSAGGSTAGPVGTLIGLGVGMAAGVVASVGAEFLKDNLKDKISKKISYHRDPQEIIKKMSELKEKYQELVVGLNYEPIGKLEQRYVKQKRDIDPSLWTEIERSLIEARFNDYYFQLNTPAIGFTLGLPLRPKPLLDHRDRFNSKKDLIERFEKDTSFSIYSKDIKNLLCDIIIQIAENSITSTSDSPLRVVEHWFGTGSTGKSTAAKEIARFLGLPYFEKRITNPDSEIKMENLTGTLRSIQGKANIGWIGEALLAKVEGSDKESYLNGFLILDDFPVNTQNAQNFLLTITDPGKKKLPNHLFQEDLNISRLNILIISNEKFKSLRPANESNPLFDALMTRFETREWPKFNEEQLRIIATPYLEKTLASKYKHPFFYEFKYVDSTRFEVKYDSQALDDMGFEVTDCMPVQISTGLNSDTTARKLKNVLENTINHHLIELIKISIEDFESFKNSEKVWELRAAAFRGHPKAISELVRRKIDSQKNKPQRNKEIMRRVAAGHEKSGNINEAKKWWTEFLKLGDWEVWPQVSKHLTYKIERKQDHKLLQYLFEFADTHDGRHQYTAEIGNHLYQTGLHSTGSVRVKCLDSSANLGNPLAIEEIRKLLLSSLPSELDDEVQKKVRNLSKLREMIGMLISDNEADQDNGFRQLFSTSEGEVRSLWTTQSRWTNLWNYFISTRELEEGDTRTLLDRMRRFGNKTDQTLVTNFHLGLVKCLGLYLSSFNRSLKEKFTSDSVEKENLVLLSKHLEFLSNLSNNNVVMDNDRENLRDLIRNLHQHYEIIHEFKVE